MEVGEKGHLLGRGGKDDWRENTAMPPFASFCHLSSARWNALNPEEHQNPIEGFRQIPAPHPINVYFYVEMID